MLKYIPHTKGYEIKITNGDTVNIKSRSVKYEKVDDLIYRTCSAHDYLVGANFLRRKTSEKIY